MKAFTTLSILFLCGLGSVLAQQNWTALTINEDLKKGANSVVRLDEGLYEINSLTSATYTIKSVVTILNEKAKHEAYVGVAYDKNTKIKTLEARVYNALGKEIKKVKKADFIDESNISGFSLYEDNRTKSFNLAQDFYPYTIEFQYALEYNFTYSTPSWYFISSENQSVELSKYTLKSPESLLPLHKVFNTNIELDQVSLNGMVTQTWTMKNIPSFIWEPHSNTGEAILPHLEFQTKEFEYSGYKGDMHSWESFGLWRKQLLEGRDVLPEQTINTIKSLTAALPDDKSKIKAVYSFVQNKTRYVSIQEGIGGLQPFEASLVDKVGYGDCKALSNYTLALLKSINIESHYAVIYAGDIKRPLSKDYVIPKSNHVILCVPNNGDTVWLECTSQTQPFGFLGSFTDDRDVLLITEKGGVLARTPRYQQSENIMKTTAIVDVVQTGDAKASINISYKGLESENGGLDAYMDKSSKEQKDWIYKNIRVANFDITDFAFDYKKEEIPIINQKININIRSLASLSGKRVFIQPNLLNKRTYVPKVVENRLHPMVLKNEYINIDSIVYNIPTNIYAEHLPEAIHIESNFGEYHAEFIYEEGKLIYKRTIKMNKGTFPADHYNKYVEFCKEIVKADKIKVVFNNRT